MRMMRMEMILAPLALLHVMLGLLVHSQAASTSHPNGTSDGVQSTLSAAGVVEANLVATALGALQLAPAELGRLNAAEQAELTEAMRAAAVSLGDRFRLRLLAAAQLNGAHRMHTASSDEFLAFLHAEPSMEPSTHAEAGGATFFATPQESPKAHGRRGRARRLQGDAAKKGDGLSSDSIALMVTAFLGIGSFIVQVARAVALAVNAVARAPLHAKGCSCTCAPSRAPPYPTGCASGVAGCG
jgi:hypothetical protein